MFYSTFHRSGCAFFLGVFFLFRRRTGRASLAHRGDAQRQHAAHGPLRGDGDARPRQRAHHLHRMRRVTRFGLFVRFRSLFSLRNAKKEKKALEGFFFPWPALKTSIRQVGRAVDQERRRPDGRRDPVVPAEDHLFAALPLRRQGPAGGARLRRQLFSSSSSSSSSSISFSFFFGFFLAGNCQVDGWWRYYVGRVPY